MNECEAWERYRQTGDSRELQERYLGLVKHLSLQIANAVKVVNQEELWGAGIEGLVNAINADDREKGTKFSTYASIRIRGALLDYLRSTDSVSRLMRSRQKELIRARLDTEAILGRSANDQDVQECLNIPHFKMQELLADHALAAEPTRLDYTVGETETREISNHDLCADPGANRPDEITQKKDILRMVCRGLSKQQRLVLILYYFEAMTMKEIAVMIGVHPSRVSQIHDGIIEKLKLSLKHRQHEFA
jgi:RNA polymerase sigma factor for flagellar operon FliA